MKLTKFHVKIPWVSLPKMPVLPPDPKAVIPEPRPITTRKILTRILHITFYLVCLAAFVALQIGIAAMGFVTTNTFMGVMTLTLAFLLYLFSGKDVRWRVFLFCALLATMSGGFGYAFGSARLSTGAFEFFVRLGFAAWILIDLGLNRSPSKLPIFAATAFVAYKIAAMVSLFVQPSLSDTNATTTQFANTLLVGSFVIGAHLYCDNWKKMRVILNALMVGVCIHALLGWIEYLYPAQYYHYYVTVMPSAIEQASSKFQSRNVAGTFNNGREYAVWLVLFIPMTLYCTVYARNFARRFFSFCLMGLVVMAIIFSASRGASVTATVALVLFLWLSANYRAAIIWTTTIVLAGLVLLSVGPYLAKALHPDNMFERWFFSKGGAMATLEPRKQVWQDALMQWRDNQVFGIGSGEFTAGRRQEASTRGQLKSGHSGYMQTLVETGLVGVSALALMLFATLILGWRAVTTTPPGTRRGLAAAFYSGCISVYLNAFTEPGFTGDRNLFVYALLFSLLIRVPIIAREELQPEMAKPRRREIGIRRGALPRRGQLPSPVDL